MGEAGAGTPRALTPAGRSTMTNDGNERLGRLDDSEEDAETSSTTEGAAAEGDYDPAQGSPGQPHPVDEDFPRTADQE